MRQRTRKVKKRGFPGKARFQLIKSENGEEITAFVKCAISHKTIIYSDGGKGIGVLDQVIKDTDGKVVYKENGEPVKRYDYELKPDVFDEKKNPLEWVYTYISNLKAEIIDIFHGVSIGFLESFIEEYNWRFNMRTTSNNMHKMETLLNLIFKAPITTEKQLKREIV